MTNRKVIPSRRPSFHLLFSLDGVAYRGSYSVDIHTWSVVEVFLSGGKVGSPLETTTRDLGVAASLAIQRGARLEDLRHSLTHLDSGDPAGPLGMFIKLVIEDMVEKGAA